MLEEMLVRMRVTMQDIVPVERLMAELMFPPEAEPLPPLTEETRVGDIVIPYTRSDT